MSLTLSNMSTQTKRLYASIGEPVIYAPALGSPISINAIVTRQSQLAPQSIPITFADGENSARILKADIIQPVRGDKIIDADGDSYTIQDVDDNFNESEHEVQLRKAA